MQTIYIFIMKRKIKQLEFKKSHQCVKSGVIEAYVKWVLKILIF